jgi:uroporphyrinogen decarboxylase
MVECGIDVLDPVQWRCTGMERAGLKRDFGDQVIFHGGMDNQRTLPFGTVADCRQEAREDLALLGPGLIYGPCHNLQVVSPPENVVAIYDEAYEVGGG